MMPLSRLSSVEVGEVTEAWREETCLLSLLPSPPVGGCRVEQGEVLLLARLEEGEILFGGERGRERGRGQSKRQTSRNRINLLIDLCSTYMLYICINTYIFSIYV